MPRKGRIQQPPLRRAPTAGQAPSLLVLDQFSEANLKDWSKRSAEIDFLYRTLYFGLQPERITRREEMLEALNRASPCSVDFKHWSRLVAYRWSLQPLSSAGSLRGFGGRFNMGIDVDESHYVKPFPALYIADSYETAYREFHQCEANNMDPDSGGLSPEELSLNESATHVRISGHIERVLDITDLSNLKPLAGVLAKFRTPAGLGPAGSLLIRVMVGFSRTDASPRAVLRPCEIERWPDFPWFFAWLS